MDRKAGLAPVGAVASVVLFAAACQGSANAPAHSSSHHARPVSAHPVSAAQIVITPAGGTRSARPERGITIRAVDGTITSVSVRAGGRPVVGRFNRRRTLWRTRWALRVGTRYRVRATAADARNRKRTATSVFRTLTPAASFSATITEGAHETYGVGMPIILSFSQPITHRREVERSLELATSRPVVGAWYWDGDQTLYFRPRRYWRPHTVVHFTGHLDGVDGAPGVYGTHTLTQTFEIGRSLIVAADTQTHHARVYLDRHLFGDWPMSSGRPGDDTPNGTYLTIEKGNPVEMKGPGYDLMVPWSVRFTWSGDYLHDAYWSVSQQGFENVSHGCVNLSPQNAQTYYELAVPGDPVTITGSPRAGTWGNGWTVWFLSWKQLVAGSAVHRAVYAGRAGSAFVSPSAFARSPGRPPLDRPAPGNAAAG
jgi:lipoprotein-anchoring transpeptidase ErfK/SrfK